MAVALMAVGSSGLELGMILAMFGLALFVGDARKSSAKGDPLKRKLVPVPGRHASAEPAEPQPSGGKDPWVRQPCHQPSAASVGEKQWYTQRIIDESRKHRWPIALRLLGEMQQCGHKPDPVVYNCMIGDCKKGSRLERAQALFERMESERVKPNVITYTALMNVASRREDADEAVRLFNLMKERAVLPNNVTYNTLITACTKAKQVERALQILCEARRENGYSPEIKAEVCRELFTELQQAGIVNDGASFSSIKNMLLEGCCQDKDLNCLARRMQARDPLADGCDRTTELIHEMLLLMLEEGTRHDKVALLRLREPSLCRKGSPPMPCPETALPARPAPGEEPSMTLVSTFERSRSMVEAKRLLKIMRDTGLRPNLATYNAVLSICDRHSMAEEALGLYEEMLHDSLSPDFTSYNFLISASAKGGNPIEGVGFLKAMQRTEKMNPTLHTYNTLLDSCVRNKLEAKAVELFRAMQQHQLTPDAGTYTTIIGMCVQTCNWSLAVDTLTAMQEQGHSPSAAVYADVIKACTCSGKGSVAQELLQAMLAKSVAPTTAVYNALLASPDAAITPQSQEALDRVHQHLQVWEDMRSAGVAPDTATFAALLASCEKAGEADKAEELFKTMTDLQLEPTGEHYAHMFCALLRAGRQEAALEYFETMSRGDGSMVDISVYNQAIAVYRTLGQHEKAFSVMDLICGQQLTPNVSTYAELISTCQKSCDGDKAFELIQQLHSQGLKADVARWNTVIDILLHSGRLDKAMNLLAEMQRYRLHTNTRTFDALIKACDKSGDAAAATTCLEMMCEQKHMSPTLLTAAANILSKAGMSEKLFELRQMWQQKHGAPLGQWTGTFVQRTRCSSHKERCRT